MPGRVDCRHKKGGLPALRAVEPVQGFGPPGMCRAARMRALTPQDSGGAAAMASRRIHSARVGHGLTSVFGGVILLAELLASGCSLPTSPSMATVPRAWRKTNPWGPEANAARAEGKLVPRFYPEQMAAWMEFARQHVQEGD